MERKELLLKIKKSIKKEENEAEIYLFGSRAREDSRSDSDWDILILTKADKVTNKLDDTFRDYLYDIELESDQIISILIYPKKYWNNEMRFSPLYKNVKKEGILL